MVRVLEIEPDLGADLDPAAFASARHELVAPIDELPWTTRSGNWGFAKGDVRLGVLLVGGLLMREVRMLDTSSAELLGAGDLLWPADGDGEHTLPVVADVAWTALTPVRAAPLGDAFLSAACRYPDVVARLMGKAVARAKALALHDAVTNLRHVETRLLVQFWHLAERWGKVGPDGVTIVLPVTHELLAKLVGAARPSVSTALGGLAARGLLTREGDAWRLSHDSRAALGPAPLRRATVSER